MRDDFTKKIKKILAERVGYRCSNPSCLKLTSGPQLILDVSLNIGVAAHITAASPSGPRYCQSLTKEERRSMYNGIWLCQNCGKLVDNDPNRYSPELLRDWKNKAEAKALAEIEGNKSFCQESKLQFPFHRKLQGLMPKLLVEMKNDLINFPTKREFVLLKHSWSYWAKGCELVYYYDDHEDLDNKIRILENYNLVRDVTSTNTRRYRITEEFADYIAQL